jgi:hypothetical protein
LLYIDAFRSVGYVISSNIYSVMNVVCYQKITISFSFGSDQFRPWPPPWNFRFTSVTRSRTIGTTPWTGYQLVARPQPVHKYRKTHTQHKHLTSLLWVGSKSTVTASARAKRVHALDGSATVTRNVTIILYETIIMRAVFYGCETSVSDVKGWSQAEGVWAQGGGGIIWTEKGRSNRRFEKTA